ncbi:acetyl-CoA C-acetyltransferase [uncultured Cetobacterium sp.]|uniref:acetyl-CoA C-acetyltransferase n=1 Tax=uncultured Cetobacterium sp. TaxID=527638 RepID=UPI00262D0674|nr:acetyl-CoA C-acetyltransferase [uncultured Cetobacterium sp.]
MKKVYIVAAKRTSIGSFLGSLSKVSPSEMAGSVIKNIIEETKINPSNLDEVIIGNVLSAGHAQGIGRQSAIKGGVPFTVPAYSINIICGSGMKAIMTAYQGIKSGESSLILAGGTESMSQAPLLLNSNIRTGIKMGDSTARDHMILDALTDAFHGIHMGITAENIAEKHGINREEQDKFSITSQIKAISAIDSGRFKDEIVPIKILDRKTSTIVDTDEYPNRKTNLEKLGTLRPAFKKDGSVTAGNSSGINDGAAVLLLASEEAIKKHNLKPLAEIIGVGQGGVDPLVMGLGPVPAIKNVLDKTGLTLEQMDLLELNEAFAVQSLGVIKEISEMYAIDPKWFGDRTNVNGGAIALGHPVGASGARITTTLIHEMKKRGSKYGLASLCIGGGMGTAIIIKNI